jgi:hypothetical protein
VPSPICLPASSSLALAVPLSPTTSSSPFSSRTKAAALIDGKEVMQVGKQVYQTRDEAEADI